MTTDTERPWARAQGTTPERTIVREAVRDHLAARQWSAGELARRAVVTPSTVADFLDGSRWPRLITLAKLDAALQLPAGSLDALAHGQPLPDPAADEQHRAEQSDRGQPRAAQQVLHFRSDVLAGLNTEELAECTAAATLAFLERARLIRTTRTPRCLAAVGTCRTHCALAVRDCAQAPVVPPD